MIGRNPKLKIIQTTHTGELAIRFGRKAKTLMDSTEYKEIFPTRLREDSQAAGRWETAQGGEYFASGVGVLLQVEAQIYLLLTIHTQSKTL